MRLSSILILILLSATASCGPDFKHLQKESNEFNLTTEAMILDEAHLAKIENFYEQGESGLFMGQDSVEIYYNIFRQEDASSPAILISAGRTEAAVKYKEVIFDLFNNGYSIYIHDHRGQGLSGRMTKDPDMGYIDDFQFYIDDMKEFHDGYVKPEAHSKLFLLAHSMGGAIGMTYLQQYPSDFDAAAFSSPMLGLIAPTCAAVDLLAGEEPEYAASQGSYEEFPFNENLITGSEIRYNRMIRAFATEPKARLGGASYQWVNRSCKHFDYMNSHIQNIETPFILFSAENEQIVDPGAHEDFVDAALALNKECIAYVVEDAQHELLLEKDEQRIETMNQIIKFYRRY